MEILCPHPASPPGVSLGWGKIPVDYSNAIKPVSVQDERAVMGTVCPHTPAPISIGKAGSVGIHGGSPEQADLALLFPVSI